MKPISLKLKNFGSYVDEFINFEDLSSNLFIICGATGSGKSFIFDAMTFAIYGLPCSERELKKLKRVTASVDEDCAVEFVFESTKKIYKIERTLKIILDKKIEGKENSKSSVKVFIFDKNQADFIKTDLNPEKDIIKLNLKQFKQVILLAQNQFSEFLKNDEAKKETLKKIFNADIAQKIAEKIIEKEKSLQTMMLPIEEGLKLAQGEYESFDIMEEELRRVKKSIPQAEKKLSEIKKSLDEKKEIRVQLLKELANAKNKKDLMEKLAVHEKNKNLIEEKRQRVLVAKKIMPAKLKLDEKNNYEQEYNRQKNDFSKLEELKNELEKKFEVAQKNMQNCDELEKSFELIDDELKEKRKLNEKIVERDKKLKNFEIAKSEFLTAQENLKKLSEIQAKIEEETLRYELYSAQLKMIEIAKKLKEGEKCPLCGSTHHPELLKEEAILFAENSSKKISDLKKQQDELSNDVVKKEANFNSCKEIYEEFIKEFGENKDISQSELQQNMGDLQNSWNKLKTQISNIKTEFNKVDKDFDTIKSNIEMAKNNLSAVKVKVDKIKTEFETIMNNLHEDVESESEIVQKYLPQTQIDSIENQIQSYMQEETYISGQLKQLENIRDEQNVKSECDKLSEQIAIFETQYKLAQDEYLADSKLFDSLQRGLKCRDEYKAQKEEILSSLQVYSYLHEKLIPRNGVTFELWYLSAFFNEVISNASNHFDKFSDGLYSFEIDTNSLVSRGQKGLNLTIRNRETGTDLPVSSLSGGEMFEASLSLALGIIESIHSHSGGIDLDSIFIDEGFGSLDEDARSIALPILRELAQTKMVGVISHVQGMQNAITSRLHVSKTENAGSKVQVSNS